MKVETRDRLRSLAERCGKEYGKIVQKLLAVAFLEAGAERVVERGVQGIDLEVTLDGRRLAIEVKTTEGDSITLGKKDAKGLLARRAEGFEIFIAVLGRGLLDEWIVARFHDGELPVGGAMKTVTLRTYRNPEIEAAVSGPFDEALARHYAGTVEGAQGYLDEMLRGYGAFAQA
ncbi:MAG: hypothetical protein R6V85_13145 [Polyangia bacterium]